MAALTIDSVAYDEELAHRVRTLVAEHGVPEEKRMFGGLAFMLGGRMACCVSGQGGLLLRVGEAAMPGLLGEHVTPMQMGAQVSTSWVRVAPAALADDDELAGWVRRGVTGTGRE